MSVLQRLLFIIPFVVLITRPGFTAVIPPIFNFQYAFCYVDRLDYVRPVHSLRAWNTEDVEKFIPNDMHSSSDGNEIAAQIFDRSLDSFFKSEHIHNSDLGKAAQKVEGALETRVTFGSHREGAVKHSLNMQMKAAQNKALLVYTGLMNANASYHLGQQRFNFEIYERIANSTEVVLAHTLKPDERRDTLSFRWKW